MRAIMRTACAAGLAIAALAGCADLGTSGSGDPVTALREFKLADLKSAEALATAEGDQVAALCWSALAKVQADKLAVQPPPEGGTVGAFTVFQKIRNLRRRVSGGIGDELKIGCGPLVVDEQGLVLRVARLVGVRLAVPVAPLP